MVPPHQDQQSTTTHLERTSAVKRAAAIYPAEICRITQETPTVKSFLLQIPPTPTSPAPELFTFLPGQWLDVFVPGVDTVGGFSITSTPKYYSDTHRLELAIQRSDHPPARWFFNQADKGDTVDIRVGGDFTLDMELLRGREVAFVAGGVGINPIASMLSAIGEGVLEGRALGPRKVTLLHSAVSVDELLFRGRVENLAAAHRDLFEGRYFVTRQAPPANVTLKSVTSLVHRRLAKADLRALLNPINMFDRPIFYICGPPQMIDDVVRWLDELGWEKNRVRFERWW